tara:strand:- start:146 stop:301 length:156 start_codon:yes stop_codon:yes gene_type:complete
LLLKDILQVEEVEQVILQEILLILQELEVLVVVLQVPQLVMVLVQQLVQME